MKNYKKKTDKLKKNNDFSYLFYNLFNIYIFVPTKFNKVSGGSFMVGIRSFGGYVPRYRLNRGNIFKSMGWINMANIALSRGEKAVANMDEDSLTMAVSASTDCINGFDKSDLGGVYFASTTFPFKERQNAGIVAGALNMKDDVRSLDFAGSLKAGTSALIAAMEACGSKGANNIVVCGSDSRLGKMGSPQELIFGEAAAAFLASDTDVIAEYKGSFSLSLDFVDHVRGGNSKFDRQWEDRWIRDMGFTQIIPQAINGFLDKFNVKMEDFSKVIYPCHYFPARKQIDKMIGLSPEKVQDTMLGEIGEMGVAQPLTMLAKALEDAKPGDKILVVGYGNGCDVLGFEVTENITKLNKRIGISGYLANRADLKEYTKYLAWRHIIDVDAGLRSEEDIWPRWSLDWRYRKTILGFCGTKCTECNVPQFPPQKICANPKCGSVNTTEEYCFADKNGKIFSYTGDNLAASFDPPQIYGNIDFDGGGRYMINFTDCELDAISVGMPVSFSFRIVRYDKARDITRYFWKAVPKQGV